MPRACSSGAAHRQQDDGLARHTRGLGKRAPVAEVLAVDGDDARCLVPRERRYDLGDIEIRLIADGDEPRIAEPHVREQEPDLERDVAALRNEPDRPCRQRVRCELELRRRVEDAEAVGPDQHRAGGAHALDDRALARGAVGSELAEPCRDGDQHTRAGRKRLLDRLLEAGGRDAQNDELRRLRQVADRVVHRQAEQLTAATPDEEDATAMCSLYRVAREPVTPFSGIG